MALTSFIKIPQLKQKLKEKFPVPKIKLDYPILVPLKTKNWTQLGTAFDYLLRFYLKQISPESIDTPWVAEGSVYKIKESSGQYVVVDGKLEKLEMKNLNKIYNEYLKKYPRGSLLSGNSKFADKYNEEICKQFGHVRQKSMSWGEPSEEWSKAIKPAEKIILDAKERYSEFLDTGKIKNNLIESSLKLAQLDLVRRAGILEINKKISKQDIDELRDLLDVAIQSKIFKKNKKYYLNPTFGKGSELVGGADADIVMDDTLVDIKVTKKLSFTQEWYNQIIGYYALSTVDNKPTKIRHIGIYFARHGILHTISIKDIEKKSDFKKIIKWFELIAANIKKR